MHAQEREASEVPKGLLVVVVGEKKIYLDGARAALVAAEVALEEEAEGGGGNGD